MKTTIHVLTVILIMNTIILYAGDPKLTMVKADVNTSFLSVNHSELTPVIPKEAGFIDYDLLSFPAISHLAPITPKEATFEDLNPESNVLFIHPEVLQKIAPETPREAGFEDTENDYAEGTETLAPVAPLTAEFDE
jgi:hypothetical protein